MIAKATSNENILYDGGWNYFELKNNELIPLASSVSDMDDRREYSLFSAIKRAKSGESKIYMFGANEYGEISAYIVDDYEAVLTAYGLGKCAHRHHITWKYSPYDNGKGAIADVDMTFHCGCVLSGKNKRTLQRDLLEQYGMNIVLSSVKSFNASRNASVRVYRNGLKDKNNDLF